MESYSETIKRCTALFQKLNCCVIPQAEKILKTSEFKKAMRHSSAVECQHLAKELVELEAQLFHLIDVLQRPIHDALAEMDSKDMGKPGYPRKSVPVPHGEHR